MNNIEVIEYIYRERREKMIQYVYDKVWSYELAEDLFQDTMIELFTKGRVGTYNLHEWIGYAWKILHSRMVKSFRNKKYKKQYSGGKKGDYYEVHINSIEFSDLLEQDLIKASTYEHDNYFERSRKYEMIDLMTYEMNFLSDRDQQLIDLKLEGYTDEAIANIFGLTKRSASETFKRIKKKLKYKITHKTKKEVIMKFELDIPEGKSGDWETEHHVVTEEDANMNRLRAAINGTYRYTPKGSYVGLKRRGKIIMSNVPDELRDMRQLRSIAGEDALINGLGLGISVHFLLQNKNFKGKITVIEKSPDVIKLCGKQFKGNKRVKIILGDAFEHKLAKGERFGVVWHDIWDDICADNVPEMGKLLIKYRRRTDWQDCWCRDECKRLQRKERREKKQHDEIMALMRG